MNNTEVVNTASKYIVKTTGAGSETDQVLVNANDLTGGTNKSLVSNSDKVGSVILKSPVLVCI